MTFYKDRECSSHLVCFIERHSIKNYYQNYITSRSGTICAFKNGVRLRRVWTFSALLEPCAVRDVVVLERLSCRSDFVVLEVAAMERLHRLLDVHC